MARLWAHHQQIDPATGHGRCSVPMWMGGCPAGFCDEPAYGPQEPGQQRYGEWGPGWLGNGRWSERAWTPGYCSALACYAHGGPAAPATVNTNTASGRGVSP